MLGYTTIGTSDMDRAVAFYGAYVRDLDGNKLCFMDMNFVEIARFLDSAKGSPAS
jgi:catechol 2,3-dioxygenase-like lactoylglutathione lyase family enzyme